MTRLGQRALAFLAVPLLTLTACVTTPAPRAEPAPACPGTELAANPTSRSADAWHRGAVVYGVIPPLFGGEPFEGVRAKLDELQALGVDALWLSPIYASDDPSGINYAVTDYFRIRPDFGTDDDLRALVADAHARGMKVLLDFVPNHTSSAHPHYQDTEVRGPASPYWDWYERDEDGAATFYFDWEDLKNLNHANPAVRRMLVESCLHWIRSFGVDGFRFDAVWAIRERHPDFLPELVQAIRAEKPDAILIAEAGARDPYYLANGFNAAYDWTEQIGRWAWEPVWNALPGIDEPLAEAIAATPSPDRVLRFLNNNDTGERFVTRHGPAATRVATALLHTLPGLAVIYAGDEIGAEYHPYADPPPIVWTDPHALRGLHRRLAYLREAMPALRDGAHVPVPTPGDPEVHAFMRDAGGDDRALVVANFGTPATVRVNVAEAASYRWDALAARPVESRVVAPGVLELAVPATTALVLTPMPRC